MDITKLYVDVDDFFKNNPDIATKKLAITDTREYKPRKNKLSNTEVMAICISFHQSGFRTFKHFYINHVSKHLTKEFPNLVSYNRFVELMNNVTQFLCLFLTSRFGTSTGISFIDSTPITVCKNKRISRNKVFKNIAKIGKSTIGWFFGFKLHIIVNEIGELLSVKVTKGNVNDRNPVLDMVKNIFGKLFADKGYISKKLTADLFAKDIKLITSVKKNMKNKLLSIVDKVLLRKRSIIETINDQLKNISQIEHSRHRSVWNFMNNLVSGLIAYTYQEKKPNIKCIGSDRCETK